MGIAQRGGGKKARQASTFKNKKIVRTDHQVEKSWGKGKVKKKEWKGSNGCGDKLEKKEAVEKKL